MHQKESSLMNRFTLTIKDKKLEDEYQLKEKSLQRRAIFPVIVLFQFGFLINYVTKLINGLS